jgi:hypothetical protein
MDLTFLQNMMDVEICKNYVTIELQNIYFSSWINWNQDIETNMKHMVVYVENFQVWKESCREDNSIQNNVGKSMELHYH